MTDTLPLPALVEAFRARLRAAAPSDDTQLIETHISLVLLAGEFAYKFKKPVNFGFVDFSTLERRRQFCTRELALNARYAPRLYLGVETVDIDGQREYAVRMRRFPAHATLAELLAGAGVDARLVQTFAGQLATQQRAAAPVEAGARPGSAALVRQQMEAVISAPLAALLPAALREALEVHLDKAMPLFTARQAAGHVRDCHGDLHCANVVAYEGVLQAFDCIEFNDELRVIDSLSDAAFLLMDLDQRDAPQLGHQFLNSYLEAADDYAGLHVLALYCAYRALVRAKVALLRGAQVSAGSAAEHGQALRHIALAQAYLLPQGRAGLVLTHGVSGSGKSHYAQKLAARSGFIHLRSDIERRRLAGLALDARSGSAPHAGLYEAAMNTATYARLLTLAREVLSAGYSVVVDATFLKEDDRAPFIALASACGAPVHILCCDAPPDELRRRVATRAALGEDVSEATVEVLERQLRQAYALTPHERCLRVTTDMIEGGGRSLAALGRPRAHL